MIGIKIKNSDWEKALLVMLKEQAEIWRAHQNYRAVLTDKGCSSKYLLVDLGTKCYRLALPFKISDLYALLGAVPVSYENAFFRWDSVHRQLECKKTKNRIQLTEKEASIVDFLCHAPGYEASKEDLLEQVWNYSGKAETHAVETTVYTLNQKLKKSAKLLTSTKKGYKLT